MTCSCRTSIAWKMQVYCLEWPKHASRTIALFELSADLCVATTVYSCSQNSCFTSKNLFKNSCLILHLVSTILDHHASLLQVVHRSIDDTSGSNDPMKACKESWCPRVSMHTTDTWLHSNVRQLWSNAISMTLHPDTVWISTHESCQTSFPTKLPEYKANVFVCRLFFTKLSDMPSSEYTTRLDHSIENQHRRTHNHPIV